MTPQQRALVQQSFGAVAPLAAAVAAQFYGRPFELDPSLRALFRGDMGTQGRHLMSTLAVAVRGLDDLEALVPIVRSLGRRHLGYGVRDEHYAAVGEALLWTLERALGDGFTPAVRAAWDAAYELLATTMKEAAAGAAGQVGGAVAA
jgi:hemoglobin-like flavoprotein